MNVFTDILKEYGADGVQKLRMLEKTSAQLARHRNHLWYNLCCKDLDITPPSLRLKTTVKKHKAKDIIKKAERALLRESTTVTTHRIADLKSKHEDLFTTINTSYLDDTNIRVRVKEHVCVVYE